MKKLFSTLILIYSVTATAQLKYQYNSFGGVLATVNELLKAPDHFHRDGGMDSTTNRHSLSFSILSADDSSSHFKISFYKDHSSYSLASITGVFPDLFPIWKAYFEPDADDIKIVTDGHAKVHEVKINDKSSYILTLNKGRKNWMIDCRIYTTP